MSNSPVFTPPRKVAHSPGVKSRAAPLGFLLSRTATSPGRLEATSTQFPPLSPLRELFFHAAVDRSTVFESFAPIGRPWLSGGGFPGSRIFHTWRGGRLPVE